jgi:hypothetical protein
MLCGLFLFLWWQIQSLALECMSFGKTQFSLQPCPW